MNWRVRIQQRCARVNQIEINNSVSDTKLLGPVYKEVG